MTRTQPRDWLTSNRSRRAGCPVRSCRRGAPWLQQGVGIIRVTSVVLVALGGFVALPAFPFDELPN